MVDRLISGFEEPDRADCLVGENCTAFVILPVVATCSESDCKFVASVAK